MARTLNIKDLSVSTGGKNIISGLSLDVEQGTVHAIMGPNGSGKSTLSFSIMGHPAYNVDKGQILLDGEDISDMPADKRSKAGLFLSFQYPSEVPGVTLANFLRTAINARREKSDKIPIPEFKRLLDEKMALLKMDMRFAARSLNQGFSGGEKKRSEILQMSMLSPGFAILDETDSGLDIDSLKIVAEGINSLRGPDIGILLITHYQRILHYIKPDMVHVMMGGRIVESGGYELAERLEKEGYGWLENRADEADRKEIEK
ncbi:MAG: Fe-S cluster assembly ATPase SufC [archaeon]